MANRILTDTDTIIWDFSTPGQAKANSVGGGGIANYWSVPSGATWAEIQDAMTDAQAEAGSSGVRQKVVLPNEPIEMTAGVDITINPVDLIGSGPLSELIINSGTDVIGSQGVFNIVFVTGVELSGFKMTFDRVSLGSSSRRHPIYVNWGSHNIDLHHLTINGATSDVFHVAGEYGANAISDVYVWKNIANEWYESYFILREGDAQNIHVFDNVGIVTTGHPSGAVSRPYGIGIDYESLYGYANNCSFSNNFLDATGLAASVSQPSLGLFSEWSDGGTGSNGLARVNNVCYKGNTVTGFYYNLFHRLINRGINPGTSSLVTYEANTCTTAGGHEIFIQPTDGDDGTLVGGTGAPGDHVVLVKNVGDVTIDLTNLAVFPGPTITEIAQ